MDGHYKCWCDVMRSMTALSYANNDKNCLISWEYGEDRCICSRKVMLENSEPYNRHVLCWINSLPPPPPPPPGQNGRHFADDIFRCILLNETFYILIEIISLKFVPKGPIDNNPALVYIMAWRRVGDKPLSEPMVQRQHWFSGAAEVPVKF